MGVPYCVVESRLDCVLHFIPVRLDRSFAPIAKKRVAPPARGSFEHFFSVVRAQREQVALREKSLIHLVEMGVA
jgi:hypothetical protein